MGRRLACNPSPTPTVTRTSLVAQEYRILNEVLDPGGDGSDSSTQFATYEICRPKEGEGILMTC